MTEFAPRVNESNPNSHETVPSGDAADPDATTKLQASGNASVTDQGPGARHRMGNKSAWALGGVIMVAVVSVALSATARLTLSSGETPITMTAAGSSVSPRASVPDTPDAPYAGRFVPLVSNSAGARQVPSGRARPTGAPTRSGKTEGSPLPSPSAVKATAPAVVTPGSPPATTTRTGTAAVPTAAPAVVTPGSPPATTTPATIAAGPAGTPVTVSVPEPVSWWTLGDRAGTTAADSMGAHPGTASNINWCIPQYGDCAAFNGTDSDIVTSGPVLDTGPGSSFTVSAVIDLTALAPNGTFETVVSQDGTENSGFYLQYSGPDQRWAFARVVSDTTAAAGIRALSTSGPSLNTWTHLVGVFDASDDQLRLYVNGVLQGTATDTTPFAANGPLAIGRGQFDGKPTDWFTGATGEIQVWNTALTSAQVARVG